MMSRIWSRCASLGSAAAMVVVSLCAVIAPAHAAVIPGATVIKAARHDTSPPLSGTRYGLSPLMQQVAGKGPLSGKRIQALHEKLVKSGLIKPADAKSLPPTRALNPVQGTRTAAHDPVLQAAASTTQSGGFTAPILSFDALGNSTHTTAYLEKSPADPSVAVGMNYTVEAVSNLYAVYDKTTGDMVFGPVDLQSLWAGFGGNCERGFMQHPVVVYDQLAQRWIFQATLSYSDGFCIAVSTTDDPTGSFYRYEYDNLPPGSTNVGYSHIGVWSDAYYVTINLINYYPQTLNSVDFIALDRNAMLQGQAAGMVIFNEPVSAGAYADLPATLEGLTPPPNGEPGLFANYISPNLFGAGQPYALALWKMQVDWSNPRGSTLQGPADITVPAFNDMLCSNQPACIPQPFPGDPLDAISDRLMPGFAYRNFGDHEAITANQTVTSDVSGNPPSGIRWYEVDTTSAGAGDWTLKQSGTYAPADGLSRWVGSLAMDHSGDMALGYSVAGTSMAPAVAYTGRLQGDADGKMTEPETTLVAGQGVQQSTANDWGGRSAMTVDPANDCTYWYGNQYYEATGSYHWSTHLAAFKFNSCVPAAVGTLQGTVTSAANGQTISGAAVAISADNIVTDTVAGGDYQLKLPAGDYSATATHYGYLPQTLSVTVSNGNAVTGNFTLQKAPTAVLSGHVLDGAGHGYGLYAEVKITTPSVGVVSDTWTDPATGAYSVTLPVGFGYTVAVTPYMDGYTAPAPTSLTLKSDQVQDFSLGVISTCTAPGYAFAAGYGEDFNERTFPPAGWTVTNGVSGSQVLWNTNVFWGVSNWTGGTGNAATIDSNVAVSRYGDSGSYDSSLVSAPIAVTSLPANPILKFKANFDKYWYSNSFEVDISVDNGAWTTVNTWNNSIGSFLALPGYNAQLDLGAYIPQGAASIRLRWRYYDLYWGDDWYAQVDDVVIGSCAPVPGGLLVGHITDSNTGAGLGGARVTDAGGDATTSIAAQADTNRPAGTYVMFLAPGQYPLSVSMPKYSSASATVDVTDNAVTTQDFSLGAGAFSATPAGLTLHAKVGGQQDAQLTVSNAGSAAAHFVLQPINAPVASSATQATGPFAPAPHYAKGTDLEAFSAVKSAKPGSGKASVKVQAAASATAGTVVADFASPIPFYGLGVDRQSNSVWLGSPSYQGFGGDDKDHQFQFDGTATGNSINVGLPGVDFMADMAFDDVTGTFWQMSVDTVINYGAQTSHIYELDPRTGLPTGKSIAVPTPQPEIGLAYNPVSNTWYAGDFNSGAIYHFDASGKLLDSWPVGLPIEGLAYNPSTGHLFVLTSGGAHAVYVLDANNGYAPVGSFDIAGYNTANSGAGFGYTCDGNLWISDFVDGAAIEVASGETGWCDIRHIPWLSLAPGSATIDKGASTQVGVTLDGTGQQAYTTTQAQLRLVGDTPYPVKTIPVTVSWDPRSVALETFAEVPPSPAVKGNYVNFNVIVINSVVSGDGPASQVALTFNLPDNFSYTPQAGGNCSNNAGTVVCLLGDLAPGARKVVTILAKADKTGPYQIDFQAMGRESQDPSYSGRNEQVVQGTVKAPGGTSGGGALGGLSLAMFLSLFCTVLFARKRTNFTKRGGDVFNRMKSNGAAAVVFAVVLLASTGLVSAHAQQSRLIRRPGAHASGLTTTSVASAHRDANLSTRFVRLAPQGNVSLLDKGKVLGQHALSSTIRLTVSLKLRNVDKLRAFLRELQNPNSPEYHHFLTPSEFTAKFGPTRKQVAQVESYLKSQGVNVTGVSANRLLIHTEATTDTYQNAFKVRIKDYRLNNRTFFSSKDSPLLPGAVAGLIRNVIGLNNAAQMRPLHQLRPLALARRQAAPMAAPPASSAYYEPVEIQKAYDWPSITDSSQGQGVRVAILTASSSDLSSADYETFWEDFGLPSHTVNIIKVDGDKSQTSGTVETLLDMEWSGAMGPGETQDVYMASDPQLSTFIDEFNQFVNDNNDQVMTTSWGAPEAAWGSLAQTADQIFMQAAAQGISMFAAAGDNNSSDGTSQSVMADFPSVDPYITAANGTDLTASLDGGYISETAWSNTGGAISQVFAQPTWQTGSGVPANGWRNNSDMAMNAGPLRPYLVYSRNNGGWLGVYGTSAVAPQFAGMFAIGVWQNGGNSLGQSNELIYGDVNAGNYATDFHDVTAGSNGAFDAGPDWDHPTGWGSPRAKSLLSHLGVQGPVGTLTGTVTDAVSGSPVSGATVTVTPGGFRRGTGNDGTYTMLLAPGTYTVTVKYFGYQIATDTVSVTDGNTTTQDVSLQPATPAKIMGHVTDGSGHGYGLYADIKVTSPNFGQVADVWTNPKDGSYSISLPEGFDYTFTVNSALDGYNTGNLDITHLAADATHDFALTISGACTAPGYKSIQGFGEDFNGAFPPAGWTTVTLPSGSPVGWKKASNFWFGTLPNYTGGSGDAAVAQAHNTIILNSPYDVQLITPVIPVSSLPPNPSVSFLLNYQNNTSDDALDVDINVDGSGWTTVAHITQSEGGFYKFQGVKYSASLAGFIPSGATSIQLRWRYYNPVNYNGWYAEIDDVSVGACETVPGGLLYGQVSDANTGSGIVGASVNDDSGDTTESLVNAVDPNLPVGAYLMFAPTGQRTVDVSDYGYAKSTTNINVSAGVVNEQNFSLKAGQLAAGSAALTFHATVNTQTHKTLTINNTGSVPAAYELLSINAPVPSANAKADFMGLVPSSPMAAVADHAALAFKQGVPQVGAPVLASSSGTAPGDVVATFRNGIPIYGLGVNRSAQSLWVGSPVVGGGDDQDHQYLFDGASTGNAMNVALPGVYYMADMAYDANTGKFWQLSVSEDGNISCIYELDPKLMQWTGKKICPSFPISQRGLAYDPVNDIWIAGDFVSQSVYGFNSDGKIVGSAHLGEPIAALAFNPSTKHLFVLTSGGNHAIYVFNAANGFIDNPTTIDIPGYNPVNAGAGLGYDCDGHLWLTDMVDQETFEVNSGETGWCSVENIPWLSAAPGSGTVANGASAQVALDIDGTGQQPFTTTQAQLRLVGETPYAEQTIPVTVNWDPQPVALVTTVQAEPSPVAVGQYLTFDVAVKNRAVQGDGNASQVELTFNLPDNLAYVVQQGQSCTKSGTTVVCDLGNIAQGAEQDLTILTTAKAKGKNTVTFTATGREPQDSNYAQADAADVQAQVGMGGGSGSGGGGELGWLSLVLLMGLVLGVRRRTL